MEPQNQMVAADRADHWPIVLALLATALLLIWLFPYVASAYHVEMGGRALDQAARSSSSPNPEALAEARAHLETALRWQEDNAQAYWLLNQAYLLGQDLAKAEQAAVRYTTLRPDNPIGWLELFYVYEAMGMKEEAKAVWHAGEFTAQDLVRAGNQAQRAKEFDKALNRYAWALEEEPNLDSGWYRLGALSQALLRSPSTRSDHLAAAYSDYIVWNGGNWIVNGGFEESTLGWSSYRPSEEDAVFEIDVSTAAEGEKSAVIEGKTSGYHGGWQQRLSLEPGTSYRYSCELRIEDAHNLTATVLYWEHSVDGRPIGHRAQTIAEEIDWTHFETELLVPVSEGGIVLYPVLATGQGRIWLDHVKLVELSGPTR